MEAHRQPENSLKGFLRHPRGTSRARSRGKPHRIKANGYRHANRTTGHSVYANDNPVRNTDPDGRQSVDLLGLTNEQLRSISTNSMVQARLSAAEEFVAPKSVSVEASGAVSGGSPIIGGAAQLSAGITLGQGSDGGAAASVYGSGGMEATSAIKEVGTVSYPLGGDGANVGGSVGRGAALSISNAPVSGVGGTSVVHNISTPIGGVSWSVGSNGIWSAGIAGPSEGVSYSKITVKTKVILSTECKAPCN